MAMVNVVTTAAYRRIYWPSLLAQSDRLGPKVHLYVHYTLDDFTFDLAFAEPIHRARPKAER